MSRIHSHSERHVVARIGWLRAAVLGANDGIISTASLIIGVAAAAPDRSAVLVAGVAGLIAGSMSMAAGEYVSVSSQADTEKADLKREAAELRHSPELELKELAGIYEARGVEPATALEVAKQLTAKDALAAHARDELGISDITTARPVQAAFTSAITFAVGALLPLLLALAVPLSIVVPAVAGASLFFLALLGGVGAKLGGAKMLKAIGRVVFWGTLAMALTAGIGRLFGTVV